MRVAEFYRKRPWSCLPSLKWNGTRWDSACDDKRAKIIHLKIQQHCVKIIHRPCCEEKERLVPLKKQHVIIHGDLPGWAIMLASLDSIVISPLLVNHASWLMLLTQAYFTISSCSFSAVSRVLLSNSWSEPKVSGFCCFILKAFKKPKKPKTKCQTWFFYCKEFTANETCLSFN